MHLQFIVLWEKLHFLFLATFRNLDVEKVTASRRQ